MGGLSLATCSVLHTARLLHAQGIGVGGRASVYGESQGSGNGSIYLAAASFSRVFTFYILIQLSPPGKPSPSASPPSSAEYFPLRLAELGQPSQLTNVEGKSCEFVTKISRVGHQQVFFCSCQLLMGAWVPIQEISLSHACSSQSQSQPRNQTAGCVFWVSAQCASESLYQQH